MGRGGVWLDKPEPRDRDAIERLLRATGAFREEEIQVAREVLNEYYADPDREYSALGAFAADGEPVGFICYGSTPLTSGTWDIYWIAVAPEAQNAGVGTLMLQEVERRLVRVGGRLALLETSSQAHYEATRAFYERRGYREVARVPDYYADGDDLVVFAKRLRSPQSE